MEDSIALILDLVDLPCLLHHHRVAAEVMEVLEERIHVVAGFIGKTCHLRRLRRIRVHVEELVAPRDILHPIHHIIHLEDQRRDVLAVEGRDEGLAQMLEDARKHLVAVGLILLHLFETVHVLWIGRDDIEVAVRC